MPIDEIRSKKISEPCSGTGEWFLSDNRFKSWRDAPESSLLWVQGSPGQGKSVLAKVALKNLEDRVLGGNLVVIYFFCFQKKEYFGHATDILQALIIQLIDCQELFQHLPTRYIEDDSKFFTAPFASLWVLFQKLLLNIGDRQVYCIIDTLDECMEDNGQRSDVLRNLVELMSREQKPIKVLLTSRPGEQDINAELQKFPPLNLQAHTEDLRAVINSQVEKLPSDSYDDKLKREIEKCLNAQAGTTFLWVSIVIKQIAGLKFPSMRDVKEVLTENPKDLDALYEKLVSRIIEIDTRQKTLQKLLYWVAYSNRELSVEELNIAIMCDPDLGTYRSLSERDADRRRINKQMIREHLGTLLEVGKRPQLFGRTEDFIYLNHQSVYDYFHGIRDRIFNGKVDIHLARTCIRYLNAKEFHQPMLNHQPSFRLRHPFDPYTFYNYACNHWYKHIKTTDDAKSEWEQIQNLLDHEKPLLEHWIRGAAIRTGFIFYRDKVTIPWLAIRFDIIWLTELIISGGYRAAAANFEVSQIVAMVKIAPKSFEYLLRVNGDKVSASSEVMEIVAQSPSAIRWMKQLLENEAAEIEITEGLLMAAASNDCKPSQSKGVVRLLLNHKAAAEFRITERLLVYAASNPDESLMRLLLTHGRDEIKLTESSVISAARNPNEKVVQLLLTHAGNEIIITEEILFSAAANRNESVIRLLLTDGVHRTRITEDVLLAAAANPMENVMRTLLTSRRPDEIETTQGVLLAAVTVGHHSVVRLLLNQPDADLVVTDLMLRTAASRHVSMMTALLDNRGREVQITEKVVSAAVGDRKVLHLLLDRHETGLQITDAGLSELRAHISHLEKAFVAGGRVSLFQHGDRYGARGM